MATNLKDLGNKVKSARNNLGISQEELANRVGYKTKGSIARIENGERDLPIDKLKLLAKALNTTPEYLVGWNIENSKLKPQSNITHFTNDLISLPLFSSISAGYGAIIDSCFIDDEEMEYIPMISFPNWQHCFAVKVKGDSMSPKICDGDIVIINTELAIENNQIGAFMIDDEAFLKRKKISNDNTLLLVSNNDNYAPIIVTKEKNYKEIGKITQIISKNID